MITDVLVIHTPIPLYGWRYEEQATPADLKRGAPPAGSLRQIRSFCRKIAVPLTLIVVTGDFAGSERTDATATPRATTRSTLATANFKMRNRKIDRPFEFRSQEHRAETDRRGSNRNPGSSEEHGPANVSTEEEDRIKSVPRAGRSADPVEGSHTSSGAVHDCALQSLSLQRDSDEANPKER